MRHPVGGLFRKAQIYSVLRSGLNRWLERPFRSMGGLIELVFQLLVDPSKARSHFPSKLHVFHSALN
jgi:hypothetical protein